VRFAVQPLPVIGRILFGAALLVLLVRLDLSDAARRVAATRPGVVVAQR
jgi:hypothetical protein